MKRNVEEGGRRRKRLRLTGARLGKRGGVAILEKKKRVIWVEFMFIDLYSYFSSMCIILLPIIDLFVGLDNYSYSSSSKW